MFISLSKESEEFVQSLIEKGVYKNVSEALDATILLHRELRQQLDDAIQEGIDDMEAGRFSTGEESYKRIKASISMKFS